MSTNRNEVQPTKNDYLDLSLNELLKKKKKPYILYERNTTEAS